MVTTVVTLHHNCLDRIDSSILTRLNIHFSLKCGNYKLMLIRIGKDSIISYLIIWKNKQKTNKHMASKFSPSFTLIWYVKIR